MSIGAVKSIAGILLVAVGLTACEEVVPIGRNTNTVRVAPALEVLSIDFERTSFRRGTSVSGALAAKQRDLRVATPSSGRLRREALGPIPTEVRIDLTSITTTDTTVTMTGTLVLRDLGFGTILASQENFSATGRLPLTTGGRIDGLVFRAVEADILDWIEELDCNTAARRCALDLLPDVEKPVIEGADLDLDSFVDNRPSGLRKLVGGAIDPDQVIAAATPVAPAAPADGGGALTEIGTTVAALGLLDRSGFWIQTPLVTEEGPGELRDPATGRSVTVTLIPKAGPAGGGSQVSLATLSELGLDATALVTLQVFR